MTRTIKTSPDISGGGTTISEPGTYHVQVLSSADGASTKGNQINGCSALLGVLAGTSEDQAEKQFHLTLFDPDLSKGESNQEWANKKQTAYGVAINQIDPSKLGEEMQLDFGNAEGQQFIISLDNNEYQGKTRLELLYANIYHVDDPRAAKFPKNKEAIGMLPKEMRRPAEYFACLQGGSVNGGSNNTGSTTPRMTEEDLNDL